MVQGANITKNLKFYSFVDIYTYFLLKKLHNVRYIDINIGTHNFFLYLCTVKFSTMKQNLFLNRVMSYGAILGFVMLASHIFEQCAIVYGGTMGWYSVMGLEYLAAMVVYIWMLYRFTKSYSLEVMEQQADVKMFGFGSGLGFAVSVSALAGVIVGLGRYILHSLIIGHTEYNSAVISSLQSVLKSNPETAAMMGTYNQMFAQMSAQPEPTILQTVVSSIWSYAIWALIVGLIIAAVVKREPDIFDTPKSEE